MAGNVGFWMNLEMNSSRKFADWRTGWDRDQGRQRGER